MLRNRNNHALVNTRLRIGALKDVWSVEVRRTTTLPKEAIRHAIAEDSVLLEIDDFPSGERIIIDILHNDIVLPWDLIKSENSNAKLVGMRVH